MADDLERHVMRLLAWCLLGSVLIHALACRPARIQRDMEVEKTGDVNATSGNESNRAASLDESRLEGQLKDTDDWDSRFHTALANKDLVEAEKIVRQRMITQPDDTVTVWALARLQAERKQFADAWQTLQQMDWSANGVEPAETLVGEIAKSSGAVFAEQPYLAWKILERLVKRTPQDQELRRSLIRLLNRLGHRHRACQHIDWLCQAGFASQQDLVGILQRRGPFPFEGLVLSDLEPPPQIPPGLLANARVLFAANRFQDACDTLSAGNAIHPEAYATALWALARAQAFVEFSRRLRSSPDACDQYAAYWSAFGLWRECERDFEGAVSSFLRAIEIDPTAASDYQHLAFCLRSLDLSAEAEGVENRGKQVKKTVVQVLMGQSDAQGIRYYSALTQALNDLGRPWEFLAWTEFLARKRNAPNSFVENLRRQRQKLLRVSNLESLSIVDRRMGMDKNRFPTPSRQEMSEMAAAFVGDTAPLDEEVTPSTRPRTIVFGDIASRVGLNFQYQNHADGRTRLLRIHEALGGGIGVIDFDQDGRPDLQCNQGGGDPPDVCAQHSSQLYRNLGTHFVVVTESSETASFEYSTGVAVGDVNQDGFPDLMVAALGRNRLLVNAGDGTFLEQSLGEEEASTYTSSLAIADVNGDHLPDLIEANYVEGESMFQEVTVSSNGVPAGTSPLNHKASADRMWIQSSEGALKAQKLETPGGSPAASLGLVVSDLDGKPGNEVFIANDAYENRLWVTDSRASRGLSERGMLCGVALDHSRVRTAGMGIAAGDFDRNQMLDLHVTNFWEQASSLFMSQGEGNFIDLSPRYELANATFYLLGFGTQALDVNSDGWLDLAILNGHIEDYSMLGHPFRMRPQLLLGGSEGFIEAEVAGDGYFEQARLGRSLAILDWNRDGRIDLAAGHLGTPVALLENQTQPMGQWLQFRCVGTGCERDATGTRITVRTNRGDWCAWVTAGDGYLCSNEKVISVAIEASAMVEQVRMDWPDGVTQQLGALETGNRYLVVQGQDADVD
ncbi:MAG: FG-GAP-like repeat-containing protein [Planctomycetota bacterium]